MQGLKTLTLVSTLAAALAFAPGCDKDKHDSSNTGANTSANQSTSSGTGASATPGTTSPSHTSETMLPKSGEDMMAGAKKTGSDAMTSARNAGDNMMAGAKKSGSEMMASAQGMAAGTKVATATIKPAPGATTQPAIGNVTGMVTFTDVGHGVKVTGHIMGLKPNSKHGIHIHQKADLSANDLSSAGPHWDPAKSNQHGGPETDKHHGGDLGNLTADAQGMANIDVTVHDIHVGSGDDKDVVGKSVIVHGGEDDLKSNPAGNSGPRIAGGAIMSSTK